MVTTQNAMATGRLCTANMARIIAQRAGGKRGFTTELRRRRTSSFIGQRNSGAGLWQTGMASGGKLWSKRVLVPLCPPQSLTSVVAIHCLVARGPAKGDLDPVGEFAFS